MYIYCKHFPFIAHEKMLVYWFQIHLQNLALIVKCVWGIGYGQAGSLLTCIYVNLYLYSLMLHPMFVVHGSYCATVFSCCGECSV